MQRERTLILCVCLFLLSGCVEPGSLNEERADTPPIHMTFEAPTLDRTEDGGPVFNLEETLVDGPVLMLWIGASCSGCHDWTELIHTSMDEGAFNNSTINVVSVHRWAQYESLEDVEETFGVESNQTHYTPWTVVTPSLTTPTYEFGTNDATGYPLYEAYGNPGTPTLQLIDQAGALVWQSKTYWANETLLLEAITFFDEDGS